jgi:methionyl-tRNA formyltransferase
MMQELPERLTAGLPGAAAAEGAEALFFKAPDMQARTIQWHLSAAEILQLVNACNPKYGGAETTFRNSPVRILEAMPVEVNNPQANVPPGTIVHADMLYGLIVSVSGGQYLRITIAQLREGYLSGSKLAQLGWQPGEKFI